VEDVAAPVASGYVHAIDGRLRVRVAGLKRSAERASARGRAPSGTGCPRIGRSGDAEAPPLTGSGFVLRVAETVFIFAIELVLQRLFTVALRNPYCLRTPSLLR